MFHNIYAIWTSLSQNGSCKVAQWLKEICLPLQETQEMQVWFLGWDDPLEEEMAIYSSILARKILWTEEPGRLQSVGSQRVGHNWATELNWCMFINCFRKNTQETTKTGYPREGQSIVMRGVWWGISFVVELLRRVWLFATAWTIARWAPLSMGFPRQDCWSRLPFPPPGDLPDPGIKPASPALAGFDTLWE